jgi:hypothetical protein
MEPDYLPQHFPLFAVNMTERNPTVRPIVGWMRYGPERWLPVVVGQSYAAPVLRHEVFIDREDATAYAESWRAREVTAK